MILYFNTGTIQNRLGKQIVYRANCNIMMRAFPKIEIMANTGQVLQPTYFWKLVPCPGNTNLCR